MWRYGANYFGAALQGGMMRRVGKAASDQFRPPTCKSVIFMGQLDIFSAQSYMWARGDLADFGSIFFKKV